ncbi:MAG TPA: LemA family protein [Gemmatimonadaceae bacterium]|nr:LemA family protein [Gemmatimonadaceae bacterium]
MRRRRFVLLALIAPLSGCGYNRIQALSQSVDAAQGQIQAQLQRRADLIPNLVQTVKGYAQHEEDVFTNVAQARSGLLTAIKSGDPGQMANADAQMTSTLGRLMVVAEAYPQLKADRSFIALQDELTGTENRIAVARGDYNDAVKQYNTYITQFPALLTAKATGAKQKAYYQATSATANEAPAVDFSKKPPLD